MMERDGYFSSKTTPLVTRADGGSFEQRDLGFACNHARAPFSEEKAIESSAQYPVHLEVD